MKKDNNKIDWTEVLPRGTAGRIHEILLSTEISTSQKHIKIPSAKTIQRILKGESEDSHGILDMAVKMSKDRLRSNEKRAQEYTLLNLKRAQPLKSII